MQFVMEEFLKSFIERRASETLQQQRQQQQQ
jgi:hypothetical protein